MAKRKPKKKEPKEVDPAEALARLADEHGMTAADLLRFPELLKKGKLKTPSLATAARADRLNREAYQQLIKRYGANQKPKLEYEEPTTTTENRKMKISKTELVALFVELGMPTADKWTIKRLQSKIKLLPGLVTEETAVSSPELLQSLLDAVESGDLLEVEGDEAPAPEKPTKAKKGKKGVRTPKAKENAPESPSEAQKGKRKAKPAKAKPAKAKAKPANNGKAERDKFGSKEGSQCAEINKLLSRKPREPSEIAEVTGFRTGRISGHLRVLEEKGLVEKVEGKGYRLAK